MTIVANYYDEVGFFESTCSTINWHDDTLELFFEKGVSLGGSDHPLAESFDLTKPCRVIFEGVVKSNLKVSHFISHPNNFDVHHFVKDDLPAAKINHTYTEFDVEGMMQATTPTGWFTWDITAEKFYFDDLEP